MNLPLRCLSLLAVAACFILPVGTTAVAAGSAPKGIAWKTRWTPELFTEAARTKRFVILDLHAVWCHWCHVMDQRTYGNKRVQEIIGQHYVAVSVDADSHPELANRYSNRSWPATIVLAADGTEIARRRGYIPPERLADLLLAIVEDPSPEPSVSAAPAIAEIAASTLPAAQRKSLLSVYDGRYDAAQGGWGEVHKSIDAAAVEYAFSQSDRGIASGEQRARQTLDANLRLMDPVWGGVYRYSDASDWSSPHFEKLLSFQADNLRLYAEAYARWQEPRYLAAASALYSYMTRFLIAPDGGFYVSQDADMSRKITGREFYAKNAKQRRALGMPRVDTREYAREAGWAIRALCKYYDVTGDEAALWDAEHGARWAIEQRSLPSGGFRHDAQDRGGPFLEDSLAMAQAFLALYRSTGQREWLRRTTTTLDFITETFRHDSVGYIAAPAPANARGVFREPTRLPEHNAAIARLANLVNRYTGNEWYRIVADHAMKYLSAYAAASPEELRAEILLADQELEGAPVHITIVGSKSDEVSQELHAAALCYPADYLQVDWWDKSEGVLPNSAIEYPRLERPAAFACTDGACSPPVFEAESVHAAVRDALTQ
jgi:hypothetical protein